MKGGLGFRNLHGFNLAMLGKQVWALLNKPDTLVARVLKGRYFSDGNLLTATRGGGSSFIWSSIWAAKEEFKKGFRWVMGNGKSIKICTDPWLKNKQDFTVERREYDLDENTKACQLFKPGELEWDEVKVAEMFDEVDARAILQIRIPQYEVEDRVAWVHTKDGSFSVKSGYRVWQENNVQLDRNAHSGGWKRLWKLKVPQKVKYFFWRFCRNNIPVRNVLQWRTNAVPISCPFCNDVEHLLHVFFDCDFASQCWQQVGIHYDMWVLEDASMWLLDKLSFENFDKLCRIAMTLWGIWFFRNKKVWENKVVSPEFAMEWSMKQLVDWNEANSKVPQMLCLSTSRGQQNGAKWRKPQMGSMKLNVDASLVEGTSSFKVGMVLRDHNGVYRGGRVMCIGREVSVLEAESIGIKEALSWVSSRVEANVCVESDSLTAVQAINQGVKFQIEVGHVFEACRLQLASSTNLSVNFVRRLANSATHVMARFPCQLNSSLDLVSPPPQVLETLMIDDFE